MGRRIERGVEREETGEGEREIYISERLRALEFLHGEVRGAICGALRMFHYWGSVHRSATEFRMSYRPGREKYSRARVCQPLKTRNWNPLPREPRRPQIARANTFVSDRPQFASLHCACARPRATRVRETHLYGFADSKERHLRFRSAQKYPVRICA